MRKEKHKFNFLQLKLWLFLSISIPAINVSAQTIIAKGTVVDQNEEPLIGVTISDIKEKKGTVTDIDGNFSIECSRGATLRFSYVGFKDITQVALGNVMKIILQEDSKTLDEVVVVGYGIQKKRDITGAVSSINAEKLISRTPTNITNALQGEVAGVQIISSSGEPGSSSTIRIRGASTFESNGANPMFIVDGVIVDNIDNINPNDVQSTEILKDGASAAIYGARAANGVIIITTKSGESEKAQINLQYTKSYTFLSNKLPQNTRRQYMLYLEGRADPTSPSTQSLDTTGIINRNNDYQDLITQTASRDEINFSISGGAGKIRNYTSIGYLDENGVILTSSLKRFTAMWKVEYSPTKFLKITSNIKGGLQKNRNIDENIFAYTLKKAPYSPLFYPNGDYIGSGDAVPNSGMRNPLLELESRSDRTTKYSATFFESAEFTLSKELRWISRGTFNLRYEENSTYTGAAVNNGIDIGEDKTTFYKNYLIDSYLDYNKSFINNSHNIHLMFGGSIENTDNKIRYTNVSQYLNENLKVPQAAEQLNNYYTSGSANSMVSLFARAEYNYQGKYLLNAVVRHDGSSRFGSKHRYGTFPAFSLGWRFSDESFMSWSKKILSDGKIRGSWGINGNDRIGDYDALMLLALGKSYSYNGIVGVIPSSRYANPELKWEETKQQNIGIDLSFLNGKATLVADFYNKKTTGLFNDDQLPTEIGFNSLRVNMGSIRNQGIEITLNLYPISTKDFSWNTSVNWSKNKNKILSIVGDPYAYSNIWWVAPGMAAGNFYGYKRLGVYSYDADNSYIINDDGTFGERLTPVFLRDGYNNVIITKERGPQVNKYLRKDGTEYTGKIGKMKNNGVIATGGDCIWEDVNYDGKIDSNDQQILGNAQPDCYIGWTNTIRYKQFSLTANFYASIGGLIYNALLYNHSRFSGGNYSSFSPISIEQGWHFQGQKTEWYIPQAPARATNNNRELDDFYLEDATYIRLQNLRLSYQLGNKIIQKAGMQNLQIYLYGNNLLTWTNYHGYDPEISTGGVLNPGKDNNKYPRSRTIGLGINISF